MYICSVLFIIFNVVCGTQDDFDPFYTGSRDVEERVDPHSLFYDRTTKTMIVKDIIVEEEVAVSDTGNVVTHLEESKSTDNHSTHEKIFYKRLINLLLSNMHIQTEDEELITGLLSIQASQSQLRILESFHEREGSLREIDAILGEVIQRPTHNTVFETQNLLNKFFGTSISILEMMAIHMDTIMIMLAVVACFFMLKSVKWRAGLPILIMLQVIFVVSFFMTWWQLIQEAEIELTAVQMQFSELPIACQPDKMNMWQKFMTIFSTDDCKKYYEAVMTNPKLRVTPATALSHLLTNSILHPAANAGLAVSNFIENATGELSYFYAWAIKVLLYGCVGIAIVMLPFCLTGASFNVGLGPLLRLGIDCSKKRGTVTSPKPVNQREPVEIILKLSDGFAAKAIKDEPDPVKQLTYVDPEAKSSNTVCKNCKHDSSDNDEEKSHRKNVAIDEETPQRIQDLKGCPKEANKDKAMEERGGGDNE